VGRYTIKYIRLDKYLSTNMYVIQRLIRTLNLTGKIVMMMRYEAYVCCLLHRRPLHEAQAY
jgi:hypothetical protein